MQWRNALITYDSTSAGESGALIPWYSSTSINTTTLAEDQKLGERWTLNGDPKSAGGNSFQRVKAYAGLTQGQLVAQAAPLTGTVTAAGSTVRVINTNITTSAANAEVDNYIYFADIAALRRIKANTSGANASFTVSLVDPSIATRPNDPDALASVPANGSAITVFRPFGVRVCTATLVPVGVALGTVTSGNYTIIQVGGLALVDTDGSGTATVYGVPGAPGAAGIATGSAAANQYLSAVGLIAMHATSADVGLAPWMINMTGV